MRANIRPVVWIALPVLLGVVTEARAQQADAGFAGSEVCQACHDEIAAKLSTSAHQAIARRRGMEERACESCHGPGAKHAESTSPGDILQPGKMRAAETDR